MSRIRTRAISGSHVVGLICALLSGCDEATTDAGAGGAGGSGGTADTTSTGSTDAGSGAATSTTGAGGGEPMLDPVFVVLAHGGFTSTTCDGGVTWQTHELSTVRDDHSEHAAFGGLASGKGAFVGGLGWGAPGHLLFSSDGTSFEDLADERFTVDGQPTAFEDSVGAVAFDGARFLAFSRYLWSSDDGRTWTGKDHAWPPGVHQLRQLRAFPSNGLIVASVETQYGEEHPLGNYMLVSSDGGATWTEGSGYDEACSNAIQHWGDIEQRGDTLIVAANEVCRSTDGGLTWEVASSGLPGTVQDVLTDGTAFFALSSERVFRSVDGDAWAEIADLGVELGAGAFGGGRFVVVDRRAARSFHSSDGVTFTEASSPMGYPDLYVRDFVYGNVSAAAGCPKE